MKNYRCFFLEISSIAMALPGLNMWKTIYKCRIKMFLSCLKKRKTHLFTGLFYRKTQFFAGLFYRKTQFFWCIFYRKTHLFKKKQKLLVWIFYNYVRLIKLFYISFFCFKCLKIKYFILCFLLCCNRVIVVEVLLYVKKYLLSCIFKKNLLKSLL